jgi:hypothetical protein
MSVARVRRERHGQLRFDPLSEQKPEDQNLYQARARQRQIFIDADAPAGERLGRAAAGAELPARRPGASETAASAASSKDCLFPITT